MALRKQEGTSSERSATGRFFVRIWQWIARPHSSLTDVGARRQAQLQMGLSLALSLTNLLGMFGSVAASAGTRSIAVLVALIMACLVAYVLGRTPWFRMGGVLLVVSLAASGYGLVLAGSEDPSGSLYSFVPTSLVIGSVLLPVWGQAVLVLANALLAALMPMVVSNIGMARAGQNAGTFFSVGLLLVVITLFRNALERTRLGALEEANVELTMARETLEQRVAERTVDLERRSDYLAASAEVSRFAGAVLDRDALIRDVVALIHERFGLYYVGLFLLDGRREWAVLRAGTGEAGEAMLARGHRLRIGEGSMVGWCIEHNQARIAQEVELDSERATVSELPDTRSEAALPLRSRGQVLGALTVQSEQSGVFDRDTVATLQVMADQVATALDNASLYAASQAALETERRAYGEASQQAWQNLLKTESDLGFRYDRGETRRAEGDWVPGMVRAADQARMVEESVDGGVTMAVPLSVRGQVVGVMHLSKMGEDAEWTEEDRGYLAAIAEQLAIALDGARLYGETQRGAARERTIAEATTRMRETLDLDALLRTAAVELRHVMDLAETEIRLGTGPVYGQPE